MVMAPNWAQGRVAFAPLGRMYHSRDSARSAETATSSTSETKSKNVQYTSGWYYCWNRMYDPLIGRWTSPDPAATPWETLNSYVSDSPVNSSDPSGLEEGVTETSEFSWGGKHVTVIVKADGSVTMKSTRGGKLLAKGKGGAAAAKAKDNAAGSALRKKFESCADGKALLDTNYATIYAGIADIGWGGHADVTARIVRIKSPNTVAPLEASGWAEAGAL